MRNLQEKEAAQSIKAVHSHYSGIKADPLSFKYSLSIPLLESRLSYTHRFFFSVHTGAMISSAGACVISPVGLFLPRRERFSSSFPPHPVHRIIRNAVTFTNRQR